MFVSFLFAVLCFQKLNEPFAVVRAVKIQLYFSAAVFLGEDGFPRIRVGIGGERKADLVDYVIGKVTEKEADALWSALNKAAEAAADIVINDINHAMQEYNIKPKRLEKEKEKAAEGEKDQIRDADPVSEKE